MKVLMIAGRVSSQAWTPGDLVRRVAGELALRGHDVTLVAESVDDPSQFAACSRVGALHKFEQSATDFPIAFASWAGRQRRAIAHDRSLSFSRVVPGADVWMPLDPSARSWLGDLIGARGVLRSLPTIAKHAGAIPEFVTPAMLRGRPRRVLAIGAVAAQGARQAVRRADVHELEFFSPVDPMPDDRAAETRRRVRALLGIPEDRMLIAVGTTGRVGPRLRGLFAEVAQAHGPMSPIPGPMLVFLTREQFPVHTLAVQAGAEKFIRVVGMSESAAEVIAASDAVAIPTPAAAGAFDAGAMGRLAATALRLGKPLIAAAGAPGAELCSRRVDGQEAGTLVDGSFGSWRRAIRMTADELWRDKAGRAAREVGGQFAMQGTIEEIADAVVP